MALENLPVWSFRPNWQSGVKETLAWSSVVLVSRVGAEQRLRMRNAPRRSWEADFLLSGDTRTRFDIATNKVGRGRWYLPVWPEGALLTTPLAAGHSTINVNTAGRGFRVGDALVLMGRDVATYDLLEIASISADSLTTVTPVAQDWPAGSKVLPCRVGRISGLSGISRYTATAVRATVQFDQDGPEDFSGTYTPAAVYRGFPVLLERPNSADALTYQSNRLTVTLDNTTGLTREYDLADMSVLGQACAYFLDGADSKQKFRSMLYALAGQTQPSWMPTFMDDFSIAAPLVATDTFVVVRNVGFTSFGGPTINRQDIVIALRDGTIAMARITNSTASGATEVLHLDGPIGVTASQAEVRSVSFVALNRLSSDNVEIDHITDVDGLATATLNFVTAPDIRSADDLPDVLLPNDAMTSELCGSPPKLWYFDTPTTDQRPLAGHPPADVPWLTYSFNTGGLVETFSSTWKAPITGASDVGQFMTQITFSNRDDIGDTSKGHSITADYFDLDFSLNLANLAEGPLQTDNIYVMESGYLTVEISLWSSVDGVVPDIVIPIRFVSSRVSSGSVFLNNFSASSSEVPYSVLQFINVLSTGATPANYGTFNCKLRYNSSGLTLFANEVMSDTTNIFGDNPGRWKVATVKFNITTRNQNNTIAPLWSTANLSIDWSNTV